MNTPATVSWTHDGRESTALWSSANAAPPPKAILEVDDSLGADEAYRLATGGTGMLFTGDYHNARQLLSAIARRIPAGPKAKRNAAAPTTARESSTSRMAFGEIGRASCRERVL